MLCRLKLASFLYSLFAFLWSNAIAVPIPSDIKEVVVFIYIEGPKGELVPNGTGFLVGVEHPRNAERMFPYLVTAKHVLSQTQDVLLPHVFLKPNGPFLPHVFLRLEKKSGALEIIKIPLVPHDAEQNVFLHQDPTVDLAVIPLWLKEDVFAYKIFPENLILSQEKFSELNITEGSDIFFAGLFTPYLGEKKNYPVVRFGHIALITSEKINWNGTMMDLYLIETFSYGGNSGAPIFFYLGVDRGSMGIYFGHQLYLAGVMMGSLSDIQPVQFLETAQLPVTRANMGIAAVVPAYKLREILFSDILNNRRGSDQ